VQSVEGKEDTFPAVTLDAVFSDVLTFLSARGDASGLISALGSPNASVLNVNDCLLELRPKAYSVAASDTALETEGLAEVVSLIDGIVFTVLSSVVGLAVAIPPVISRISADALGLIRQHIETIITLVTSLVR
jgi:hypothetical protein